MKGANLRISRLCAELGISSSCYYSKEARLKKRDIEGYRVIKKYFDQSKYKDGVRQLKMRIEREEGLVYSHKRIARIKRKFGLITQIRRKNKYRYFAQRKMEHETCPNYLDRNFGGLSADQVYCTDVTELRYKNKKAYFAAVKDIGTNEIVGASVSNRIDIRLTNQAIDEAIDRLSSAKKKTLMVHSDQGFHFTHFSFRERLASQGILQSMSRKGNCLDNAPIESFFGHFKDHLDLDKCESIEDVKKEVTAVIDYYNHTRPQLGLKKMPPSEYRRHLQSSPGFF